MHHVFKLKNNRLNNRDFNIDQNNRDYDFFGIIGQHHIHVSCSGTAIEMIGQYTLITDSHNNRYVW